MTGDRLRLGMVGGGKLAGIGEWHRMGARLDGRFELVAGCFSRDPARNAEAALRLGVAAERCYPDHRAMAEAEAKRKDRIDLVAVVTPNESHAAIAASFVERGFHVLCEKPLAFDPVPALALARAVKRAGTVFAMSHYYAGFAMLRQARAMIEAGTLGQIRHVHAEHASEGLALGRPDGKPPVSVIADLGVHGVFIARYVAGQRIEKLSADAAHFIPGRAVEDDARVLLRFSGGGRGVLWLSHSAAGVHRSIRLRVIGARGALEWDIVRPDLLRYTPVGEATRLLHRAGDGLAEDARVSRLPSGHAEGTIEAFANLYADIAGAIGEPGKAKPLYPTIEDGVAGAAFIAACAESVGRDGAWVAVAPVTVAGGA